MPNRTLSVAGRMLVEGDAPPEGEGFDEVTEDAPAYAAPAAPDAPGPPRKPQTPRKPRKPGALLTALSRPAIALWPLPVGWEGC